VTSKFEEDQTKTVVAIDDREI